MADFLLNGRVNTGQLTSDIVSAVLNASKTLSTRPLNIPIKKATITSKAASDLRKDIQAKLSSKSLKVKIDAASIASHTLIDRSLKINTAAFRKTGDAIVALTRKLDSVTKALNASSSVRRSMQSPKKLARGGLVPGFGLGDSVPAMLSPGEYVLNRHTVRAIGPRNLTKFARGGRVLRLAEGSTGTVQAPKGVKTPRVESKPVPRLKAIHKNFKLAALTSSDASRTVRSGELGKDQSVTEAFRKMLTKTFPQSSNFRRGILTSVGPAEFESAGLKGGISEQIKQFTISHMKSAAKKVEAAIIKQFKELPSGVKFTGDDNSDIFELFGGASIAGNIFELTMAKIKNKIKKHDKPDAAGKGSGQDPFDFPNMGASDWKGLYNLKDSTQHTEIKFRKATAQNLLRKEINYISKNPSKLSSFFSLKTLSPQKPEEGSTEDQLLKAGTLKRATGGFIGGVGNRDTVPAMLTPGEFVINKRSATAIGPNRLHQLNRAPVQHFEEGGTVTSIRSGSLGIIAGEGAKSKVTSKSITGKDGLLTKLQSVPGFGQVKKIEASEFPVTRVKDAVSKQITSMVSNILEKAVTGSMDVFESHLKGSKLIKQRSEIEKLPGFKDLRKNFGGAAIAGNLFQAGLAAIVGNLQQERTDDAIDFKHLPSNAFSDLFGANAPFTDAKFSTANTHGREMVNKAINHIKAFENDKYKLFNAARGEKAKEKDLTTEEKLLLKRVNRGEEVTRRDLKGNKLKKAFATLISSGRLQRGVSAEGFEILQRATGGTIPGFGDTDSVPALLTPGEFVINKRSASMLGLPRLKSLNRAHMGGRIRGYNRGGFVKRLATGGDPGSGGGGFLGGGSFGTNSKDIIAMAGAMESRLGPAIKDSAAFMNTFGEAVGKSTVRMTAFAIGSRIMFGITDSVRAAVQQIVAMNQAMTNLNKIFQLSVSELNTFKGQIIGLAKEFGVGIEEITNATTIFVQQGLSVTETLSAVEASILAVNAANLSFTDATELITVAVNSFRLSFDDAASVIDKLTTIADSSAASVNDLTQILRRSGAAAATAGLSLEQFAAITAVVRESTRLSATTIGAGMKTILVGVQQNESVLAKYGISIREMSGEMISTMDIIDRISTRWKDLTKEQQVSLAASIAGKRRFTEFAAVMNGFGKAQDLVAKSANSAGNAQAKQAAQLETIATAMNRFQSTLAEIVNDLGEAGGESALRDLINAGSDVAKVFGTIAKVLGNIPGSLPTIAFLLFFKTALPKIAEMSSGIQGFFSRLIRGSSEAKQAGAGLSKTFLNNADAIRTEINAQNALNKSRKDISKTDKAPSSKGGDATDIVKRIEGGGLKGGNLAEARVANQLIKELMIQQEQVAEELRKEEEAITSELDKQRQLKLAANKRLVKGRQEGGVGGMAGHRASDLKEATRANTEIKKLAADQNRIRGNINNKVEQAGALLKQQAGNEKFITDEIKRQKDQRRQQLAQSTLVASTLVVGLATAAEHVADSNAAAEELRGNFTGVNHDVKDFADGIQKGAIAFQGLVGLVGGPWAAALAVVVTITSVITNQAKTRQQAVAKTIKLMDERLAILREDEALSGKLVGLTNQRNELLEKGNIAALKKLALSQAEENVKRNQAIREKTAGTEAGRDIEILTVGEEQARILELMADGSKSLADAQRDGAEKVDKFKLAIQSSNTILESTLGLFKEFQNATGPLGASFTDLGDRIDVAIVSSEFATRAFAKMVDFTGAGRIANFFDVNPLERFNVELDFSRAQMEKVKAAALKGSGGFDTLKLVLDETASSLTALKNKQAEIGGVGIAPAIDNDITRLELLQEKLIQAQSQVKASMSEMANSVAKFAAKDELTIDSEEIEKKIREVHEKLKALNIPVEDFDKELKQKFKINAIKSVGALTKILKRLKASIKDVAQEAKLFQLGQSAKASLESLQLQKDMNIELIFGNEIQAQRLTTLNKETSLLRKRQHLSTSLLLNTQALNVAGETFTRTLKDHLDKKKEEARVTRAQIRMNKEAFGDEGDGVMAATKIGKEAGLDETQVKFALNKDNLKKFEEELRAIEGEIKSAGDDFSTAFERIDFTKLSDPATASTQINNLLEINRLAGDHIELLQKQKEEGSNTGEAISKIQKKVLKLTEDIIKGTVDWNKVIKDLKANKFKEITNELREQVKNIKKIATHKIKLNFDRKSAVADARILARDFGATFKATSAKFLAGLTEKISLEATKDDPKASAQVRRTAAEAVLAAEKKLVNEKAQNETSLIDEKDRIERARIEAERAMRNEIIDKEYVLLSKWFELVQSLDLAAENITSSTRQAGIGAEAKSEAENRKGKISDLKEEFALNKKNRDAEAKARSDLAKKFGTLADSFSDELAASVADAGTQGVAVSGARLRVESAQGADAAAKARVKAVEDAPPDPKAGKIVRDGRWEIANTDLAEAQKRAVSAAQELADATKNLAEGQKKAVEIQKAVANNTRLHNSAKEASVRIAKDAAQKVIAAAKEEASEKVRLAQLPSGDDTRQIEKELRATEVVRTAEARATIKTSGGDASAQALKARGVQDEAADAERGRLLEAQAAANATAAAAVAAETQRELHALDQQHVQKMSELRLQAIDEELSRGRQDLDQRIAAEIDASETILEGERVWGKEKLALGAAERKEAGRNREALIKIDESEALGVQAAGGDELAAFDPRKKAVKQRRQEELRHLDVVKDLELKQARRHAEFNLRKIKERAKFDANRIAETNALEIAAQKNRELVLASSKQRATADAAAAEAVRNPGILNTANRIVQEASAQVATKAGEEGITGAERNRILVDQKELAQRQLQETEKLVEALLKDIKKEGIGAATPDRIAEITGGAATLTEEAGGSKEQQDATKKVVAAQVKARIAEAEQFRAQEQEIVEKDTENRAAVAENANAENFSIAIQEAKIREDRIRNAMQQAFDMLMSTAMTILEDTLVNSVEEGVTQNEAMKASLKQNITGIVSAIGGIISAFGPVGAVVGGVMQIGAGIASAINKKKDAEKRKKKLAEEKKKKETKAFVDKAVDTSDKIFKKWIEIDELIRGMTPEEKVARLNGVFAKQVAIASLIEDKQEREVQIAEKKLELAKETEKVAVAQFKKIIAAGKEGFKFSAQDIIGTKLGVKLAERIAKDPSAAFSVSMVPQLSAALDKGLKAIEITDPEMAKQVERNIAAVGLLKLGVVDTLQEGLALQESWEDKILKAADLTNTLLAELVRVQAGEDVDPKLIANAMELLSSGGNAARGSLTSFEIQRLIGSAEREKSMMPAGSRLVVANDSETIFTRKQSKAVFGGRGGMQNFAAGTAPPAESREVKFEDLNINLTIDSNRVVRLSGIDQIDKSFRNALEEKLAGTASQDEMDAVREVAQSIMGELVKKRVMSPLAGSQLNRMQRKKRR